MPTNSEHQRLEMPDLDHMFNLDSFFKKIKGTISEVYKELIYVNERLDAVENHS